TIRVGGRCRARYSRWRANQARFCFRPAIRSMAASLRRGVISSQCSFHRSGGMRCAMSGRTAFRNSSLKISSVMLPAMARRMSGSGSLLVASLSEYLRSHRFLVGELGGLAGLGNEAPGPYDRQAGADGRAEIMQIEVVPVRA